jgi:adenine-specific DNA-methyltransferase
LPKRQWLWSSERVSNALKNDDLEFLKDKDGAWTVHTKQYLIDEEGKQREIKAFSIIDDVYTQHGTNEVLDILGNAQIFSFPKPTELIKKLMNIGLENNDEIILDLFSGSCSSAHAILDQNLKDSRNRKFICVQLPEPTDENSEAFKAGYKTIADIGKERIRRVIKKLEDKANQKPDMFTEKDKKPDLGFKVLKLAKSNFSGWNSEVVKTEEAVNLQLFNHVKHISPEAVQEAILYELLLKSRFQLTTPIKTLSFTDNTLHEKPTPSKKAAMKVYSIGENELLICLEKNLTHELLKAIAEKKPERVICLDEGFHNNDQLKTNAALIMKSHGVLKFQTV